ncbi:MAG: VOC family protein [Candidatus Cyclobacteriaceae bacterium M3_2C_046]
MKIEHIAIWVRDLEKMRQFYQHYFNCQSNQKYENPGKGFSSYFLSFDQGARLEIMHKESLQIPQQKEYTGIIHFAISVGSKEKVDELTSRFRDDGYEVVSGPRTTGDGYYESVILDPENNQVEVTA